MVGRGRQRPVLPGAGPRRTIAQQAGDQEQHGLHAVALQDRVGRACRPSSAT
ncbi:Uncharacterised protein [Bordetella pertussis]|nr:Uncharacterised protein [Bordetella pertussis]